MSRRKRKTNQSGSDRVSWHLNTFSVKKWVPNLVPRTNFGQMEILKLVHPQHPPFVRPRSISARIICFQTLDVLMLGVANVGSN